MAFKTKPFLHQNQPSRESIFCGEAGGWCAKRAVSVLNFLPKIRQERLYCVRVYGQRRIKHVRLRTPARTVVRHAVRGQRRRHHENTETICWKYRNHLLEMQKSSAISSQFSTCRERVKSQLVVRPLINYFRLFPSLSARLPFACRHLVCLILSM